MPEENRVAVIGLCYFHGGGGGGDCAQVLVSAVAAFKVMQDLAMYECVLQRQSCQVS